MIKTGQVLPTTALLGTYLKPAWLGWILKHRPHVTVWLDGDEPGIAARARVMQTLRRFGVECGAIETRADPKYHDRQAICQYLGV